MLIRFSMGLAGLLFWGAPSAAAADLSAGLLGHWTFDEDSPLGVKDESGHKMHGAFVGFGEGAHAEGVVGKALRFDGQDDYVQFAPRALDFSGGLTFALWAKPTRAGEWTRFICLGNGPSRDNIYFTRYSGKNRLYFAASSEGRRFSISSQKVIELNEWQHFAVTVNVEGQAVLYKNGKELVRENARLPSTVIRTRNYLGKSNWWDQDDTLFQGLMDDVRIYGRALSAAEIASLPGVGGAIASKTTGAGTAPRLLAHFTFDGSSETMLRDSVTGVFLVAQGEGRPKTNQANKSEIPALRKGRCIRLLPSQSHSLVLPASLTAGRKTFSFSWWIYLTKENDDGGHMMSNRNEGGGSGDFGVMSRGGHVGYWSGLGRADGIFRSDSHHLAVNKWNHLALTCDGKTLLLHLNGEVVYPRGLSAGRGLNDLGIHFGSAGNYEPRYSQGFHRGYYDDLRIYDTGLSAEQVRMIMRGREPGSAAGKPRVAAASKLSKAEQLLALNRDLNVEEMLTVIDEKLASAGSSAAADSNGKRTAGRAGARQGKPAGRAELSADAEVLVKQAKRRAQIRANYYTRNRLYWRLADIFLRLEQFPRAAQQYATIARKRTPNNDYPLPDTSRLKYHTSNSYLTRYGQIEARYAEVLMQANQSVAAQQQLAKSRDRIMKAGYSMRSSVSRPTVGAISFIAAYAANKARLDELEASYTATPDGDTLWQIIQLCARTYVEPGRSSSTRTDGARQPLRWLTACAEMLAKFPDHARVQSGVVHQRFAWALRRHELYEKAIEVVQAYIADYPTARRYPKDDAYWNLVETYGELGVFYDEMKDKARAAKTYQAAIEAINVFAKKFPDDSRSKSYTNRESGRTTAALTNRQTSMLLNVLARVRRGR